MQKKLAILTAALLSPLAMAQDAAPKPVDRDGAASPLVTRMMAFDANKDGKLTKEEVTDARLLRLFERADADKDGTVTKDELTKLAAVMDAEGGGRGERGGPGGPGGGFGGPGGPGGRGGPGMGRGPGGRPGMILPPMLQERLNLSEEQRKQVADLQKEVDEKLAKILNEDQRKELQAMRERGPGGPGGPGGFGGPPGGGFRGGPPGGPGGPDAPPPPPPPPPTQQQ